MPKFVTPDLTDHTIGMAKGRSPAWVRCHIVFHRPDPADEDGRRLISFCRLVIGAVQPIKSKWRYTLFGAAPEYETTLHKVNKIAAQRVMSEAAGL